MGVVLKEEYVCDYCKRPATPGEVLVGTMTTHRKGAKGRGSKPARLVFHPTCAGKLTKDAGRPVRTRRTRGVVSAN
jgi:hypothetical protein